MNDINQRISRCFANVFPDIRPNQIAAASTTSLSGWDSVAHITLLAAISEEFDLEFAPEDFEELISFPRIVNYVESRVNQKPSNK
jgi:acyl carrier protein